MRQILRRIRGWGGFAPIGANVTITSPTAVTVKIDAAITLAAGTVIGQVQAPIEQAISNYLRSVRQAWDDNTSDTGVAYAADVYTARVTAAILSVEGVVNAAEIQLNGSTSDLILTETGAVQQVPVLGTVTLHE